LSRKANREYDDQERGRQHSQLGYLLYGEKLNVSFIIYPSFPTSSPIFRTRASDQTNKVLSWTPNDSTSFTLITNVSVRNSPMVMQISYLGRRVYLCEICASGYSDQTTANSCESYCRTHTTCSRELKKRAILKPE